MATPDYDQWLNSVWGWPTEDLSALPSLFGVNGIRPSGANPPVTAYDFLQMYPKFFGPSVPLLIETRAGSVQVAAVPTDGVTFAQLIVAPGVIAPGTAISSTSSESMELDGDFTADVRAVLNVPGTDGVLAGQPLTGVSVPQGATVSVVGETTITMSAPAVTTAADEEFDVGILALVLTAPALTTNIVTAQVYTAPPVPLPIINVYLNLARSSLDAARWGEGWLPAVCLYAAHFITLWMQSESGTFTNAASIARKGLSAGLMTSKSADGLSASYTPLTSLQDWGAWNLTGYGQLLATQAAVIGAGSMLIW